MCRIFEIPAEKLWNAELFPSMTNLVAFKLAVELAKPRFGIRDESTFTVIKRTK